MTESTFAQFPVAQLRRLVEEEWAHLRGDKTRTKARLKDEFPEFELEVFVLSVSLDAGASSLSSQSRPNQSLAREAGRLSQLLVSRYGLQEQAARWSVAAWGYALDRWPIQAVSNALTGQTYDRWLADLDHVAQGAPIQDDQPAPAPAATIEATVEQTRSEPVVTADDSRTKLDQRDTTLSPNLTATSVTPGLMGNISTTQRGPAIGAARDRRLVFGICAGFAVIAAIAVAVVVSQPGGSGTPLTQGAPPSGSWPQDGYDAGHSGFNPMEQTITAGNVGGLRMAWHTRHAMGMPTLWSAVSVGSDTAFAGSNGGTWAFDAATGSVEWHDGWTGQTQASQPCLAGGVLYVGNGSGILYAINPDTGKLEWQLNTQQETATHVALTSPTVANGAAYVGSLGMGTVAVSIGARSELWTANASTRTTSPTVIADQVLLGSADGVQALQAKTGAGQEAWGTRFTPPSVTFSAPTAMGSSVFATGTVQEASTRDSNEFALDMATGRKIWRYDAGQTLSQPAVANASVFLAANNGTAIRLDATTGKPNWMVSPSGTTAGNLFYWRPTVANGVVYVGGVGSGREMLFSVSAVSGDTLWTHNWPETLAVGEVSSSEPAVVDSDVFVSNSCKGCDGASAAAGVYAFALPSG